jgi:hypothetical protein
VRALGTAGADTRRIRTPKATLYICVSVNGGDSRRRAGAGNAAAHKVFDGMRR